MLDHLEPRRVTVLNRRAKLYLGRGPLALEVVMVALDGRPRIADLKAMFRARSGRRAAPVLIVAPWARGGRRCAAPSQQSLRGGYRAPLRGRVESAARPGLDLTEPVLRNSLRREGMDR